MSSVCRGDGRRTRTAAASGFTLVEIIVVLGVVAALVAILTPMVTGHIEDARLQRAQGDARTVGDALLAAHKDLGDFPIFRDNSDRALADSSTYDVLHGPGDVPGLAGAGWSAAYDSGNDADTFANQLIRNTPGYPTTGRFQWRGPYLDAPSPDPWGNAYLVNAENLRPAQPHAAYVLSAGPDGVVQTDFDLDRTGADVLPAGDDILFRLR